MISALTYGAAASDSLVLVSGSLNPSTPVGTPAVNPLIVRVVAADGVTPVSGATIGWAATNSLQLSACAGATSCSAMTDESGYASTILTPSAPGTSGITATLAPGAYSPAKSVSATLSATESTSDIGALTPYVWIAQGATVSLPLTARVMSNGVPKVNTKVNFTVSSGTATLSAASAQSDANGNATVTVNIPQIAAVVQVGACIAPANTPCKPFYLSPVPLANLQLQPISGGGQISEGQPFQPVSVRVTDSASPPNSVVGATVAFLTTVLRPSGESAGGAIPATLLILSVSQSSATSDGNGMVSITPSSGGYSAPLEVDVGVTAGVSAALDYPLQMLPPFDNGTNAGTGKTGIRLPQRIEEWKLQTR